MQTSVNTVIQKSKMREPRSASAERRICSLPTIGCIRNVHTVHSLQRDSLQAVAYNGAGSRLWVGSLWQINSPAACRQAWAFPSLHYLEQRVGLSITAAQPHCFCLWPTGTLAMATQIPADFAVKNRSSQKYERQEPLIPRAHSGFTAQSGMCWSHDRRLHRCCFFFFLLFYFCQDLSQLLHKFSVGGMKWSISFRNRLRKSAKIQHWAFAIVWVEDCEKLSVSALISKWHQHDYYLIWIIVSPSSLKQCLAPQSSIAAHKHFFCWRYIRCKGKVRSLMFSSIVLSSWLYFGCFKIWIQKKNISDFF